MENNQFRSTDEIIDPICPNCGTENEPGDLFCAKCGTKLNAQITDWICPSCGSTNHKSNRFCGNCGTLFNAQITDWVCPTCNNTNNISNKFCGKCGTPKYLNDSQCQNHNTTSSPYSQSTYASTGNTPKPRFMALGIIGLVFGIIGFLILPIVFNVLGLIFAIISFSSNPKEEKEGTKAIWQYKNKARGIGMSALIINIVGLVLMILNMMRFSGMFLEDRKFIL